MRLHRKLYPDLKPCPDGKIRSPVSRRCVNVDGKTGKEVIRKMMELKSPRSRPSSRFRKSLSKKSINKSTDKFIKNLHRQLYPNLKPCPDGKIRSPESNRCVTIDGRAGKEVIREMTRSQRSVIAPPAEYPDLSPDIPTFIDKMFSNDKKQRERLKKFDPKISKMGFRELYFLGKGKFGETFVVEDIATKKLAIIKKTEELSELQAYEYINKLNLNIGSPRLIKYRIDDGEVYISMKLDDYAVNVGMFDAIIQKHQDEIVNAWNDEGMFLLDCMILSIESVIRALSTHNLAHGDFHLDNIGFQQTSAMSRSAISSIILSDNVAASPLLIDLANLSRFKSPFPDLDFIQLIRTVVIFFNVKKENIKIQEYLYYRILDLMDKYCIYLRSNQFKSIKDYTQDDKHTISDLYITLLTYYTSGTLTVPGDVPVISSSGRMKWRVSKPNPVNSTLMDEIKKVPKLIVSYKDQYHKIVNNTVIFMFNVRLPAVTFKDLNMDLSKNMKAFYVEVLHTLLPDYNNTYFERLPKNQLIELFSEIVEFEAPPLLHDTMGVGGLPRIQTYDNDFYALIIPEQDYNDDVFVVLLEESGEVVATLFRKDFSELSKKELIRLAELVKLKVPPSIKQKSLKELIERRVYFMDKTPGKRNLSAREIVRMKIMSRLEKEEIEKIRQRYPVDM